MSESASSPVVIVGTGLSGYTLARELRKLDTETPLLLITADDGRSYSKPMLSNGFTKEKTADELAQADAATMEKNLNARIRTHTRVTALDPDNHCLHIGDEKVPYSRLVIAWGADVIRLNFSGDGADCVHSVNDLMDYGRFREALDGCRHVAIIGAGLIGCEFANDLHNGGFDVDVIAPSDTVLPGLLPQTAAEAVRNGLAEAGVRFHLEQAVEGVDRREGGVRLHLDSGETLDADAAISAVGLKPRTQLAAQASLEVGRGIRVNQKLETSAPDVYALGDCAEVEGHVLPYVMPLMAAARALAKTLTGEPTPVHYGSMPVTIKTPACPTAVCPPPANADGAWEVEADGHDVRALFRSPQGKLLGFAVTGRHASEKQALSREVPPILPV